MEMMMESLSYTATLPDQLPFRGVFDGLAEMIFNRSFTSSPNILPYAYSDEPRRETMETERILNIDLNRPITIEIEKNGSVFTASNNDFNIHEIGLSREEVLREFNSTFAHFVDYYQDIEESRLTGYASHLKTLFSSIVAGK